MLLSADQSYLLSESNPLVVESDGESYKIISGPKDIIEKLEKKKDEAWQLILNQERFKSLPQEIIDLKKNNFGRIGEFAINTNPSAKLCEYLIVNEKIARMIHVALGSGFEPDRATEYHTDIRSLSINRDKSAGNLVNASGMITVAAPAMAPAKKSNVERSKWSGAWLLNRSS